MAEKELNEQQQAKEDKKYRRVVRRRVVVEEEETDRPDPAQYELVKFIFFNEEQRGVPQPYEWIDKWLKIGQCKGMMYDGQIYKLPRIAFEYYRDQCFEPVRSNVEEEIVPGQRSMVSRVTGKKFRFRMQEVA
jgi:hypothetical protein